MSSFVQHEIGLSRPFGNCVTAAVIDNQNNLIAGFVFHNYDPDGQVIEVSGAALSPKWFQRKILNELFSYLFAHCQMVVARTDPENKRALRCWRALGAQEYEIPRLRGRNKSEIISTLADDVWANSKLNEARHGKKFTAPPA